MSSFGSVGFGALTGRPTTSPRDALRITTTTPASTGGAQGITTTSIITPVANPAPSIQPTPLRTTPDNFGVAGSGNGGISGLGIVTLPTPSPPIIATGGFNPDSGGRARNGGGTVIGGIINDQTINSSTNPPPEDYVVDVTYIPYMRKIDIDLFSYNLRPRREVSLFFDSINMSSFFEIPNVVKIYGKKTFNGRNHSEPEDITLVGGSAMVYHSEYDSTANTTSLYISHITTSTTNVITGNVATGSISGVTGNVMAYEHHSGLARLGSNTSHILLSMDSPNSAGYFVGNTISIVTGENAGFTANIIAYGNRTAQVSPNFPRSIDPNIKIIYSIGDNRRKYNGPIYQGLFTTNLGVLVGTLHIPEPYTHWLKIPTGDRNIVIIDSPNGPNASEYTTKAMYRFISNGLNMEKAQMPVPTVTTITNTIVNPTPQYYENGYWGQGGGGPDRGGDGANTGAY